MTDSHSMWTTPWWHDLVPWKRFTSDSFHARRQLVRLLPRVDARLTAVVAAIVVASAVAQTGFTLATASVVASVADAAGRGVSSDAGGRMLVALAVMGCLFVLPSVLAPLQTALVESLRRRVDAHVRQRVMAAMLGPFTVAHLEDPSLADLVRDARGLGTAAHTPGRALAGLTQRLSRRASNLGAAALIGVFFSWPVAVGLVVIGLVARSMALRSTGDTAAVLLGQTALLRRSDYLRELALTPGPAKEVRVFGLARWLVDRFTEAWVSSMQPVWRQRRRSQRGTTSVAVVLWVLPAMGVFLLAARAAARGDLSLAALAVVLQSVMAAPSADVQGFDWDIELGARAMPGLLALEEATATPAATGSPVTAAVPERVIRFENVRFAYPGIGSDVLRGLDLQIPAGRSLAIVGENGAGKTTLVKLLARLYDPGEGRITVDGVDLRELDPLAWQRRVAAIFQDFVRYQMPASDNVGFGAHERGADREALERAAARAGAAGIVHALPHGWDTVLSREYERGADLSGGEWQRVALARALFAVGNGAGVLVLDEPTANLDVRAEAELYERFLEITRGATTVLISHRFSTVRHADTICVLDGGRVVEQGTHDELIATNGRYARMFRLQAARFQEEPADA